jgi:hypothetical protein
MGVIVKPNTFTQGQLPTGQQWDNNFSILYDCINGNIDADNVADNAITEGKIANGTLTAGKIATDVDFTNTQEFCFSGTSESSGDHADVKVYDRTDISGNHYPWFRGGNFNRGENTTGRGLAVYNLGPYRGGHIKIIMLKAVPSNGTFRPIFWGTDSVAGDVRRCGESARVPENQSTGVGMLIYSQTEDGGVGRWVMLNFWKP